jgi:hypothetical protein
MAELVALGCPDQASAHGRSNEAIPEREADTMDIRIHSTRAALAAGMTVALAIGILAVSVPALAAGPATVGLGTAEPFAVLAGTPAITNTGSSTITGDVGIDPAAAVTGFPPGIVNGTLHTADAVAVQAKVDLTNAYLDAAGRPATATHATLGGLTLASGVYNAGGATLDLTGTVTLDGQNDPSAVWIFQATSDLVTASASTVRVINGGQACNVFWQVTSSATIGSGSTFVGSILALTSITMASGVSMDGRALARNGAVTLINDTITRRTCSAPAPTASPAATATPAPSATGAPARSATPVPQATAGLPATDTGAAAEPRDAGLTPTLAFVFILLVTLMALAGSSRRFRAG